MGLINYFVFKKSNFKRLKTVGELPNLKEVSSKAFKVIIPAVIETFFLGLISVADTMMVSTVSPEAIASVGLTTQPVFISLAFVFALVVGVNAVVARRYGENDQVGANKTLRQSLMIGGGVALILSIISILFARFFMGLMGAEADTIDGATQYFQIVSLGLVFNAVRLIINAAQRGIGKTKISMFTNVLANIINVVFNFLLINGIWFFPELGIIGAAIATVLGNFVAFVISFACVYNKKERFLHFNLIDDWRFDKQTLGSLYSVTWSALVEQVFTRFGFLTFSLIVTNLGTEKFITHQICMNIMHLVFTFGDGFAIGTMSLVGKSLGEKRQDLAVVYAKFSQITSFMCAVFLGVLVYIFKAPLINMYLTAQGDSASSVDPQVIYSTANSLMIITCITFIPQNFQWVVTSVLRGAGDTKYTAMTSLISIAIVRPIASYVLCYPLGLGLYGAWIGIFIDQTIRASMNIYRYESGKWMHVRV